MPDVASQLGTATGDVCATCRRRPPECSCIGESAERSLAEAVAMLDSRLGEIIVIANKEWARFTETRPKYRDIGPDGTVCRTCLHARWDCECPAAPPPTNEIAARAIERVDARAEELIAVLDKRCGELGQLLSKATETFAPPRRRAWYPSRLQWVVLWCTFIAVVALRFDYEDRSWAAALAGLLLFWQLSRSSGATKR